MAEPQHYRIAEWAKRYEVNTSNDRARPGDKLRQKPLDYIRSQIHGRDLGPGLRRLMAKARKQSRAEIADLVIWAAFGIFHKMTEIAGNETADLRGLLLNEKGQLATAEDLAFILDYRKPSEFREILELLKHDEIGWLEPPTEKQIQTFQGKQGKSKLLIRQDKTREDKTRQDKRKRTMSRTALKSRHSLKPAKGGPGGKQISKRAGKKSGAERKATAKTTEVKKLKQIFLACTMEQLRWSKHGPKTPEQIRRDYDSLARLADVVQRECPRPQMLKAQLDKLAVLFEEKYTAAEAGALKWPFGAFSAAARKRYPNWNKPRSKT